jgi:DNA helicase-2/ATP-dependent DNA helicase PcrA
MVDEYQDTNRPQYLLIHRWPRDIATCVWSATPISRSTMARRRPEEHSRFRARLPRSHSRPPRAQLPIDAGHPGRCVSRDRAESQPQGEALYTERRGGAKIRYYRAADDLDEAEFIARTGARHCTTIPRQRRDSLSHQRPVAHARGRAASLGHAYRIIGGVRFYERKEIKDALAYSSSCSLRTTT